MKLHLPSRLRAALLSCFSAVAMTLASGVLLQSARAATLYFDTTSAKLSRITWQDGSFFANDGDPSQAAFAAGDDVYLQKSAALTLGADVSAGVVNVQDNAEVVLTGNGHNLTAMNVEIGKASTLRLTDDVLAAGVKVRGYSDSLLVVDFNGATASVDTHLDGFKGRVEVNGCTWSTAPTANTAYSRVSLTGNATLQLANNSVLKAPVVMLGENTVHVANGKATLQGELSGSGKLTKTGTGTLNIGPSDEVFRGTLDIQSGSVQWRDDVVNGEVQNMANRLAFDTIEVASGATFEDGHLGRNLSGITGIVLHGGGKVMAYDMKNPGSSVVGLTENVYGSLHVDGSGTLDFDYKGARRFELLTATSGATLTVNNGRERTVSTFDLIRDFHGTINGEAKSDTNRLVIGEVSQADGLKLTVTPAVTAADFTKSGAGALELSNTLTATGTTAVTGGSLKATGAVTTTRLAVSGASTNFTAENNVTASSGVSLNGIVVVKGALTEGSVDTDEALRVMGGSLTVEGNVSFSGAAEFSSATAMLKRNLTASAHDDSRISVKSGADVTVQGTTEATSLVMSGGQFKAAAVHVHDMTLAGGTLTSAAEVQVAESMLLNGGDLLMQEGNTGVQAGVLQVAGGSTLQAKSLAVKSLTLTNGTLTIADDVMVSDRLTMNYGGTLSIGNALTLGDGAVLSYDSALANTVQLAPSDLSTVSRLYIDVANVTEADLQSGLNTGLAYGLKDKLSIGALADYAFENRGGILYLVANSKTPVFGWDAAWGTVENATAPETMPEVDWTTVAEKVGLYGSSYYDKDNVIAANVAGGTVTGNVSRVNQIFGGAYGTQPIDAAGGTIERNIWLNIAGGKFEVVGGGSYSLTSPLGSTSGSSSAWNLKGDTHVQIQAGAAVGSVFGSNVNAVKDPTHTGDSYVSVYSSLVAGSVVGSGFQTRGQEGNTYVYIYKPLGLNDPTSVIDRTITDMSEGMLGSSVAANAVVGGVLAGNNANMAGSTNVTLDFGNSGGTMVKTLVGGNMSQGTQAQTGDVTMLLHHVSSSYFRGGHEAVVSGHFAGANQTHTGDARLEIIDARNSLFSGRIVGGHDSTFNSAVQTRVGSTEVLIADAGNARLEGDVAAGHYLVGGVSYSQQQTGDVSLTVNNAAGISMKGTVVTSGHYASMPAAVISTATALQTHTGNTTFTFSNINNAVVSSILVGGHYLSDTFCEGHTNHNNHGGDTNPVQEQNGAVAMSLSGVSGAVFSRNIVVGHYDTGSDCVDATDVIIQLNLQQKQRGDAVLVIDNTHATYTGNWLVGGHFSDAHTNSLTTQSHTDGDIRVTIGNGTFSNKVVMGDVHDFTNDWNSTITGGTYLTVTGGTFKNEVVGGSLHTGPNGSTAHVGSVHMDLSNASFSGNSEEHVAIVGGYDINGRGTATVGDISLALNKVTVNDEIYGGTWYRGGTNYSVSQGNITIDLKDSAIKGNIYAAGRAECAGILTSSTTVALADTVSFARIQVSGGYKNTAPRPDSASLVTGTKTLSFVSAGSDYSNIANVTFTEFDTVNVAEADTTVTLNQNLQLMAQSITKTGAGTLNTSVENELDNFSVREGTLHLAGNSIGPNSTAKALAKGTLIEHLLVEKGATLDISAGNCGINGMLTMAEESALTVRVNQGAAAVTDLNWAGPVTLNVLDATPANMAEGYEIKLFSGLTQTHVSGLELDRISGIDGMAVAAAGYISSPYADDAFIILREDGSLVLSSKERRSAFWLNGSGEWNTTDDDWYEDEIPVGSPKAYESDSRTFFVGDGSVADVEIAEAVTPYALTVSDGTFNFASVSDKSVSLKSDLVVENADATFDNEVQFGTYSDISVDADSSLALNGNDTVTVYGVDNAGTLDVNGADMTVTNALRNSGTLKAASLELSKGTQQGGTVIAGDVKLGGDTTFDALQAAAVTGNAGHTLSLKGDSGIDTIDGGHLKVSAGTTTLHQDTALTSVGGSGQLKAESKLSLEKASAMGALQAQELVVSDTLKVDSELRVGSLTLANVGSMTAANALISASSVAANTPGSTLDVTLQDSALQNKSLLTNAVYYLLKADSIGCDITVNGADSEQVLDGRYLYTITADTHGLKLTSAVQNKDFYSSLASSENGQAAGSILDSLFTTGNAALAHPESDVTKLVNSLDTLAAARDTAALEKLAAAAAGASIPGLGLALGHDVERQLRAIRNRTTTMGVDQTVVNEQMPYVNAWVNAEGDFSSVSGDGTAAGYTMNSFGGTVGMDVDMTPHLTCGLALTAMHGKYSSDDLDNGEGNITTEYLSLFGRYARHSWTHTFVATAGIAQADLDRTVQHAGGSYSTSGSTDGTAFGLMYEVGHVSALTADGTACIQPFANVSFVHASLSGYEEEGSDAALKVDDISYNAVTFGVGARLQGIGGENIYNRSAIYEVRALAKIHAGDRSAEADMSFIGGTAATMTSAEVGTVGAEMGAGITIPVGGEGSSLFADVSVELNSAYTQINGTVGYRVNF